jgi:tripartite-type tricarboxylate transporter receptor subunit TctC
MKMLLSFALFALGTLSAGAPLAQAQGYPVKPVRFIINFPPGGPTDIVGRMAADTLARSWGVQVVADNRGGAGGNIGAEMCARSAPDGYTLCMFTVAQSIAPSIYSKLAYDPVKDFAHVTLLATLPSLLMVHPSVPAKNVQELVKLAKAKPGTLSYASTGNGTSPHMLMEMFKMLAGINLVHIPYKGAAPAMIDQISGQVEAGFSTAIAALPYVQQGKVRALAISTRERFPPLPDLPTMEQAGVKGFEGSSWNAVVMPAGTPREIVTRINRELVKLMHTPETKERMIAMGGIAIGSSPEEFVAYLKADMERWAKVAQAAKVKLD